MQEQDSPNGQAKVCRPDRTVLILVQEQEVVRLDVSVDEAFGVALGDEPDNGPHDLGDPSLCIAMLLDFVQDASTSAQLHHQMHAHVILKDILHRVMTLSCCFAHWSAQMQQL